MDETKVVATEPEDVLITVCKECRRASCWYGVFMCDAARGADTVKVPRSILLQEKRENADYLTDATYKTHCGDEPPFVTDIAHKEGNTP